MGILIALSVVLAVLTSGQCEKMISLENTTYVNIMDNGKLMASKQMNMSIDQNMITVTPKSLMETNDTMTFDEVDITGKTFNLEDETAETTPIASKRVVGTVADINSGTLTLTVDVFTAGGNLTIDNEVTTVMEGDVRVSLRLADYVFNESSTMLKMGFTVEGSQTLAMNANDKTTDGLTYDLGGNGMVKLSKKEMVASETKDVMPEVSGNMVTVMFNKTANAADAYTYSFVLKLADVDIKEPEPSSSTRVASLGVLVAFMSLLHAMLW